MTDLRRRDAVALGLVVLGFAAAGVLAGFVWERLWTPPMGVVVDHRWGPADSLALQAQFSGTGWYVVVGAVAGLLLGVVATLLVDRAPVLTLLAVVVGAVLGKKLPERSIQIGAAALFLVFGAYMLMENAFPALPVLLVGAISVTIVLALAALVRALPERMRPPVLRPQRAPDEVDA